MNRHTVRTLAASFLILALLACRTEAGPGAHFESEWGGSEVTTVTIEKRVTTLPDGTVIEEAGILEEKAVAHGLGDNVKGLGAAVLGYLMGGS